MSRLLVTGQQLRNLPSKVTKSEPERILSKSVVVHTDRQKHTILFIIDDIDSNRDMNY